jgi:putative oxidoreductase
LRRSPTLCSTFPSFARSPHHPLTHSAPRRHDYPPPKPGRTPVEVIAMRKLTETLFPGFPEGRVGAALLVLRGIVGLAFIFHGLPKVQDVGAFAGAMKLPYALAFVAAWTEVAGGALLILGLLTPVAALLLAVQMAVAMGMVHIPHHHPFVNAKGSSYELALLYLVANVGFLLAGPGAYSLDAALTRRAEATEPVLERRRGLA